MEDGNIWAKIASIPIHHMKLVSKIDTSIDKIVKSI